MTNEEYAMRIQAGERELIPQLWNQIERFVCWKANRVINEAALFGGVEFMDLYQSGFLAMCDAVERFKPENGLFITLFNLCLKTAFAEACGYRTETQKRDPLHTAARLEVPLDGGDANSDTMLDMVPDPSDAYQDADQKIWCEQLHDELETALNSLPAKQGQVLRRRFYDDLSVRECGEAMGCGAAEARKLERKARYTLRWGKASDRLRCFLELRTNYFDNVGPAAFIRTHESGVERQVFRRDELSHRSVG